MPVIARAAILIGLMALAACGRPSPEKSAVDNNTAAMTVALEKTADNLQAIADNAADQNAADAIAEVADNLEAAKDDVANTAAATKANMQ